MSAYLSLLGAIIFEVAGTLMLPLTKEFSEKLPTFIMSICYFASFYFLTLALRAIPLAIVYACWSGLGVLSIAVLSYFIYGQGIKLASYLRIILNSKWSNSC
jgi:small multidrug resistance pump